MSDTNIIIPISITDLLIKYVKEAYFPFFQKTEAAMLSKWQSSDKQAIMSKLAKSVKTPINDNPYGCIIWQRKTQSSGYPRTTVSIKHRMKSTSVLVHRLVYFICHPSDVNRAAGLEVSHLCHNKSCVNPDHLLLESRTLNRNRKKCNKWKCCTGHALKKDCLIWLAYTICMSVSIMCSNLTLTWFHDSAILVPVLVLGYYKIP